MKKIDNSIKIEELDIHEIGVWPLKYRVITIVICSICFFFLLYYLILRKSANELTVNNNNIRSSIDGFREIFQQSSNLDLYVKQMSQIEDLLKNLLKKLPTKGELPLLLEDISQQAISAGLVFKLIKPEEPIDKGFYFEQPIKMIMTGKYHGFGKFSAGISGLSRIVTLHEFSIRNDANNTPQNSNTMLTIEVQAKTYWYLEQEKL